MKRSLCRWLCVLLCAFSLAPASAGGEAVINEPPEELTLDERGFLPADDQRTEYLWRDPEAGLWQYVTKTLFIRIERHTDDTPLTWYETEVRASAQSPLQTLVTGGSKPGRKLQNPLSFAKENKAVLAITDDFSGYRIQKKKTPGIVIRDGLVLGSKTRRSNRTRSWPNLDTLAVFQDGRMEANVCDAYTAQEYLDRGATSVFAFGPILVKSGEIGPDLLNENYYPYREPRMAIGMIAPYHYLILTVVGRDEESGGARLSWLAERFVALGVTEAINLDGGGTAALMFMGEVLNRSPKNMRSVNSLIAFGMSGAGE